MGEWPEDIDIPEQVFVPDNADASEIAARDEFNRQNPPIKGLSVPEDLRTIELVKRPWRNNLGRWFELAENRVLSAHLAELPPGGNSVRHRHTTEAFLYIVKGEGYSIVNYEGEPEVPGDPGHGARPPHAVPPDRAPPDAAEDRRRHRLRGRRRRRRIAGGGRDRTAAALERDARGAADELDRG